MASEYKSRINKVKAIQWIGNNQSAISAFCPEAYPPAEDDLPLLVHTPAGFRTIDVGGYIVYYTDLVFDVMDEAIFEFLYEEKYE